MSNKLKPCPFCGSEAVIQEHWPDCGSRTWFQAACLNPECGDCGDTEEEATKLWNTRVNNAYRTKVRALVDAAKEVPRHYRLYRERGVVPAAEQYQEMISAIVRLEAALAALEAEDD